MSVNEESISSTVMNVEPMEVEQKIKPQQLNESLKASKWHDSQFESYCASKLASEKVAAAVTVPVSQIPNSQLRLSTPGNRAARPKATGARPTANRRQNPRSLVNASRPLRSAFLAAGLPQSSSIAGPAVANSFVGDVTHQTDIAAPLVKAVMGQKVNVQSPFVLPADGSCIVFQVADPGTKLAIPTGATDGNKLFLSNSGGVKAVTSPSRTSRTPRIISRSRPAKNSHPLNAMHVAGSSVPTVAASHLVRSSLSAVSSNIVIMNSPVTVTASVMVPALSTGAVETGNSGRIIRLAGLQNFPSSPVCAGSSRPITGVVQFPASCPSPATTSAHRFILTKPAGTKFLTPQATLGPIRPMSPLTSFRMQNLKNVQKTRLPATAPRDLSEVHPVAKEPEKLTLKRVASISVGSAPEEGQEQPRKRRRFVSGKAYCITLPDGKKFVGFWENSMIRNFVGVPMGVGGQVDKSSAVSDDGVLTPQFGADNSLLSATATETLVDEIANLSKDHFFYCAKCHTLTSNNVLCATCKVLTLPCSEPSSVASVPESPEKTSNVDPSSSSSALPAAIPHIAPAISSLTPSMAPPPRQLASNVGPLKSPQKIIVIQSGISSAKQIQITRKTPEPIPSSSALRLSVPVRIHGSVLSSVANARKSLAGLRPVRKKVFQVQKRAEPDVVQILSSDDEDNQATHPDPQPLAPSSASSSSSGVSHSTNVTSQDSQEKHSDTVVTDASSASQEQAVASADCQLSIKIRIVRFGTLQRTRVVQCTMLVDGIKITFNNDEALGCHSLFIPAVDLKVVRVHYGPCGPVLFIQTVVGVAAQLREILPFQDHFFDPEHKDDAYRYITIIPDKNQVMDEKVVSAMLEKMQAGCPAGQRFVVQTIAGDTASQLLKAKPSSLSLGTAGKAPMQTVFYITASGQIIQRQVMAGELAARPTEGDEEEEMADRSRSPSPLHPTFIGPIIKLFTYPPPPATGGITVANEDFFCLKDGEFLNDVIIDFYLKYLQREVLSKEDRDRTHVFSSFFYRRLVQKQTNEQKDSTMTLQQLRHCRVKKWTKHVDLFSKDFIIVPINESAHWYLAIVCFPGLGGVDSVERKVSSSADVISDKDGKCSIAGQEAQPEKKDVTQTEDNLNDSFVKKPCILVFDSLAMPTRYSVVRTLREYLQCEWDAKKKTKEGCRNFNKDSMQGACPRCPRQTNFSDCGVYVLQYVESFFSNPIRNFTLPISTLANWFSEEVIVSKRETLRQLVLRLQKELNPKLDFDPCQNSVDILTTGATVQLLSPASGSSVVEATNRVDPEGATAVTGMADSSKELHLAAPDGTQQNGNVAQKMDSAVGPPETEASSTRPDDANQNNFSTFTGLSDAVDSVFDAQSVTTKQEQETDRAVNRGDEGEIAVGETVGKAAVSCEEVSLSHLSTQLQVAQTSDTMSAVGESSVLSDNAVFTATRANGCAFSETLTNDADDASTKGCNNSDNFSLQDDQLFSSDPVNDIGDGRIENVTSYCNGQVACNSVFKTHEALSPFEQISCEDIGESVEADAPYSSKLCSHDTEYGFSSRKEASDSDCPANETCTTVDNPSS